MAKRENNYSRTDERTDFKDPKNIELSLDYLESAGKLKQKMVLPPRFITPRCIEYYDSVI